MGRLSIRELRRRGVPQEDLDLARITQEAQRRTGSQVQSVGVLVGAVTPHRRGGPNPPTDFTKQALRRRGSYDQAALLLDQQALQELSPERAARARELGQGAKELGAAGQIEFDFWRGNVSIAFQFQDAVTERLMAKAPTVAVRDRALVTLGQIIRHLAWQSHECTKTAAELCDTLRYDKGDMARTLQLLEDVGAIQRVKRGRTKVITVTPEGAFRGNVNNHGQAVERYRLDVIEGGKASTPAE